MTSTSSQRDREHHRAGVEDKPSVLIVKQGFMLNYMFGKARRRQVDRGAANSRLRVSALGAAKANLGLAAREFSPLVITVIHNCLRCFCTKPKMIQPLMGNFPESRVNIVAPFELTGVDYAGPISVKEDKYKPRIVKAYIALFVCLVSKAIHLKLVSDLSSEAFLAALDRFINRRGKVRRIFSDNGTNFVGASKQLRQLRAIFDSETTKANINDFLLRREVEWEFIPPRSPNFGGLWEAGVKVVKLHLARTLGNVTLTIEKFYTVLTHVESIVNSRPLYSSSVDPNDPQPISPAHLMFGRPLEPIPKPYYADIPANRLTRWQCLNQLRD
ncbi:uncharacterized protein LOC128735530 [Sabethes cyaneus]|uniref:uncharacterized protein LOC128735530 n=1 Tax=Sabethes cyaneus TaxID=53552 RepID=UPI00237D8A74|nr:uncharacterized protein LOC128735530 [Sabethes cyaneus]